MSKLASIDMFGEQMIFTIQGNSALKSNFGGLFTILLAIIGVFMFFFMGQSFIFKKNPSTTQTSTSLPYPPFTNTIYQSKLFIAVKVVTSLGTTGTDGKYFYANYAKFV